MMENYKLIKSYLETLPVGMTVEEAINNIKKAETMKEESLDKINKAMLENVGKCYYYDDIDDRATIVKFFVKITGTKITYDREKVLYVATVIEVSDDTIYFMENTTFCNGDLRMFML